MDKYKTFMWPKKEHAMYVIVHNLELLRFEYWNLEILPKIWENLNLLFPDFLELFKIKPIEFGV